MCFLKMLSRRRRTPRVESRPRHAPPGMGVYEGREAFWRAGRRIWNGRAHFKFGWTTQANSFKSSCRATIVMMQPADLRYGEHVAMVRWLNIACNRGVSVQEVHKDAPYSTTTVYRSLKAFPNARSHPGSLVLGLGIL